MHEEKHPSGAILFKKDPIEEDMDTVLEDIKVLKQELSLLKTKYKELEDMIKKAK